MLFYSFFVKLRLLTINIFTDQNINFMKKLLLSLLLIMSVALSTYCQESKNDQSVYCEIIGDGNFSGKKIKVEIFFGEVIHDKIKQQAEKVKSKKFTSMLDALNYMAKEGWKLEQTYVITETSGVNRGCFFHYILSSKISE